MVKPGNCPWQLQLSSFSCSWRPCRPSLSYTDSTLWSSQLQLRCCRSIMEGFPYWRRYTTTDFQQHHSDVSWRSNCITELTTSTFMTVFPSTTARKHQFDWFVIISYVLIYASGHLFYTLSLSVTTLTIYNLLINVNCCGTAWIKNLIQVNDFSWKPASVRTFSISLHQLVMVWSRAATSSAFWAAFMQSCAVFTSLISALNAGILSMFFTLTSAPIYRPHALLQASLLSYKKTPLQRWQISRTGPKGHLNINTKLECQEYTPAIRLQNIRCA